MSYEEMDNILMEIVKNIFITIHEVAKSAAQLGSREPVLPALQQEPGPVLRQGCEL